ncbi:MAG: hypothetical protein KKH12_09955 [Gammaproteobacteria bacterium]|nr:hypothetical protein [Gammaproteobacteria bacterium]MBU1481986.1 hypothetical protein [Gammaproteobacteria bacterium]
MPASGTDKALNILPGPSEQAKTGKDKAVLESPVAPGNRLRKTSVQEDVDSDYAEEAEDFYYGEGM